ncbi:MAG TPA: hypothetical protein VM686_00375 [Polyangiaceae bacterium]|nr:hypothetical protein [Polyangiaceae bacterium]
MAALSHALIGAAATLTLCLAGAIVYAIYQRGQRDKAEADFWRTVGQHRDRGAVWQTVDRLGEQARREGLN